MSDAESAEHSRHRHVYDEVVLDQVQCLECGNRSDITETEAIGKSKPVPRERRAACSSCGHRDDPLAFHHEFKWDEMSEEERENAKNARARAESKMVAYQYSSHGIASRRKP